MLLVHRDIYGWITTAMAYEVVDDMGKPDPNGRHVWVEQLEVSGNLDWRPHVAQFIQEIHELQPNVTGAYWQRRDRPGRRNHWFPLKQLLNFARRDNAKLSLA